MFFYGRVHEFMLAAYPHAKPVDGDIPVAHKRTAILADPSTARHGGGHRRIAHDLHPRAEHQDGLTIFAPVLHEHTEAEETARGSIVPPYSPSSLVRPAVDALLPVRVLLGVAKCARQLLEASGQTLVRYAQDT